VNLVHLDDTTVPVRYITSVSKVFPDADVEQININRQCVNIDAQRRIREQEGREAKEHELYPMEPMKWMIKVNVLGHKIAYTVRDQDEVNIHARRRYILGLMEQENG
jgi:hypothetical protein